MSENKYAVYQYGYAIFGIGTTTDDAIEDAKQYADDLPNEIPMYAGQNIDGTMYLIVVTDRLYEEVARIGGADVPIECSSYPYVWDVAGDEE